MTEKIPKTYRVSKDIAKALHLLAVQNDLPIGDLLGAFLKFQKSGKYLNRPEEKDRFENMWGQAVLSAKRAGKSGWTGKNDEPGVVVIIDENTNP